jgi:HAD superfamily hydrolase (TIGR01509 family)
VPARPAGTDPGPDAVLFDMDGTLLDSEKIWDVGLDALAAHLGGHLSPAARLAMLGSPIALSIRLVHEDLGIDADPAQSQAYLLDCVAAIFADDLHWRPGARELVTAVSEAGLPTGLVTSTVRRLTDVALDWMGRDWFTVSVCGDETPTQKPTPAPYLRAAELLGVAPDRCLAVEDSPIGIASAEAAGLAVLAVPSEAHIPPAPTRVVRGDLVDVTVGELRDIYAQLRTTPAR